MVDNTSESVATPDSFGDGKIDRRVTVLMLWGVLTMLLAGLSACLAPQPQIIVQTRLMEREPDGATIEVVTRVVTVTMSVTPCATPSPTAAQQAIRFSCGVRALPKAGVAACERMADWLSTHSSLLFQFVPMRSEEETCRALVAGGLDFAILSGVGYLATAKAVDGVLLALVREGGALRYAGWYVQADLLRRGRGLTPIVRLSDLANKSVAFTQPSSLAGHVLPAAALRDAGADPKERLFVAGDAEAILAVYRGEVDGAAAYWAPAGPGGALGDARRALVGSRDDIAQNVKVLWTSGPVPDDVIAFHTGLTAGHRQSALAALAEWAITEDGRALLKQVYGADGLMPVSAADWNSPRRAMVTLGLDPMDLVREGDRLLEIDLSR